MSILGAIILGIVEGLTEFLPVSSTGHLILAGHLLSFTGPDAATFEIFIQPGAILAVVWDFRNSIIELGRKIRSHRDARGFVINVGLAFLPAACVGLLVGDLVKQYLFAPLTVAGALVAGGVAMYAIEVKLPVRPPGPPERITTRQAIGVGVAQIAALFPGVSRSAATIMGGMLFGLDRRAATEFSFYLAIPTLGAATIYDLLHNLDALDTTDILPFSVGLVTSFVVALLVIRLFLKYVRTHDFRPLAVYRIIAGVVVLWVFAVA